MADVQEAMAVLSAPPLVASAWVCAAFAVACYVTQQLTGNLSQVDKLWSVTPAVYVWTHALWGEPNPRLSLLALCVSAWAARLTLNFARRDGYAWPPWSGDEDYRWVHVRKMMPNRVAWELFSLLFIAVYQHFLLLAIAAPAAVVFANPREPLGVLDLVLCLLCAVLLAIETCADNAQFAFQSEKHRQRAAKEQLKGDFKRGFLTDGLFSWCRHPNYAAEQAIWVVVYLFSVVASGKVVNVTCIGAVLLVLLFQGSANFSEAISARKYPDYAQYQARVPKFVPTTLPWCRKV